MRVGAFGVARSGGTEILIAMVRNIVSWLSCVVLLGGAVGLLTASEINPPANPPADQVIAIIGAQLIDGRGGEPLSDSVVVLRGERIEAVGQRGEVTIPEEAEVVRAEGLSLLPGLLDSHFHSRYNTTTPVTYQLNHGITSFRDPGHPLRFYDPVREATTPMPRVFLCGAHLDGPPPVWPDQAVVVVNAEQARRTVHAHVNRGASAIKVYFRLALPHIRAACEAARERGVPVTAHLELVSVPDAIRAGVRGIEHVTSFGTALARSEDVGRFTRAVRADSNARRQLRHWLWSTIDLEGNPALDSLVELLLTERVTISPTLAIFERREGINGATAADEAAFETMKKFIGICHRSGVPIVIGSHTSAPFAEKGRAYQREMELLLDCGMTPLEVIRAGTLDAARFLEVEPRLGTVEEGKLGDLVLVAGDPSKNLNAMKHVERVLLNGRWIRLPEK